MSEQVAMPRYEAVNIPRPVDTIDAKMFIHHDHDTTWIEIQCLSTVAFVVDSQSLRVMAGKMLQWADMLDAEAQL